MRRKKWLWLGFAMLCALAVAIGWLAKSDDDLAGLEPLHPSVTMHVLNSQVVSTEYGLHVPATAVLAALRCKSVKDITGGRTAPPRGYDLVLPSGRKALLTEFAITQPYCVLLLDGDYWPWYARAWITLKRRLGFD
jgi:hypothetical protein